MFGLGPDSPGFQDMRRRFEEQGRESLKKREQKNPRFDPGWEEFKNKFFDPLGPDAFSELDKCEIRISPGPGFERCLGSELGWVDWRWKQFEEEYKDDLLEINWS